MCSLRLSGHLRRLVILAVSLLASTPVFSQNAPTEPTPPKRRSATAPPVKKTASPSASTKSGAKSSNVREGKLVSFDLEHEQLTLKETVKGSKTDTKYTLTTKTRFLKAHFEAQPEDLKVGESIVLKLRKVRGKDEFTVFECCDAETYEWLTKLRKSPATGKIKEIGEETLTLTVAKDEIIYLISDKTQWEKAGQTVTSATFRAGETVTVAPRALPSGTIMAKIVADKLPEPKAKGKTGKSSKSATKRASTSLRGVIANLDFGARRFTLIMDGGNRVFTFGANTLVRIRTKTASLSVLRNGQNVSVQVVDPIDAPDVAKRITIEATLSRAKKSSVQIAPTKTDE